MIETDLKLEYKINELNEDAIPVIIVAAGNSTRMGQNKQFMEIYSVPVIARTLLAFQNSEYISKIILVTKAEDIFIMQSLCSKYGIDKISDIVGGGDSRQESVLKGFERLSDSDKCVLVHDGARPLITNKVIGDVATALKIHKAVTCAVKVKDTIKVVDKNGKVVNTPDRSTLVSVQTPQGIHKNEYLESVKNAKDISVFTDDMSVMESAGFDVYTVDGDYKNIKITTPEDILSAEAFLGEEE